MKFLFKKISILIVLLSVFSGFISARDFYDISIEFPEGWQTMNYSLMLCSIAPSEGNDDFAENVTLVREKIDPDMDVSEYAEAAIKSVSSVMKNFRLLKSGDNFAFFTSESNGMELAQFQQYLIVNGYAYCITFSSTIDEFDYWIDTFDEILSSVEY